MKIGKKNEFQWKWAFRIKHVKCYRTIPICPLQLWTLISLDYFKYNIHDNWDKNEFQWKWVYRIKHVKCYRMVPIYPVQLWTISSLDYFKYNIHENWEKKMNFNTSGFFGLSTSNAIEWYPYNLSNYGF